MERFADRIAIDPQRLHEVETRMSAIHFLARKYHIDSHALVAHSQKLQQQLTQLQQAKSTLAELEQKRVTVQAQYQCKAEQLHASRKKHSEQLARELSKSIQKLGMPKGWIEIEITALDKIHPHGQDKVEYKVCTNPGMDPDSLHKIASGGELSRISLAIQLITAQRGATPTLLFDEVDVGIGGATAALVGQMLRQLGERLQVFCVTHQPQVAASAHHHYLVSKKSDTHHTYTQIQPLFNDTKINEIARMLGGLVITDQTRSHAKELLAQSGEFV